MQLRQNRLSKQTSTLLKKVQHLTNEELYKGSDDNNVPWLGHVFKLHSELLGETCTGCPSEIPRYINNIKNYKQMSTENKVPKYRLKPGAILRVAGTSKVYSEHNITDAIAEKLLKENPNRKVLFVSAPTIEKSPLQVLLDENTKKELQAKAESLGIDVEGNKAVIAQAILDAN